MSSGIAFALPTPTPTPKPASEVLNDQINDLKDRIASRVAQLKLVERRGIIGTATDISNTQITIKDIKNNIRFIDVDELTKFSSPSSKDFGISDITKGNKLAVLGLYNKESRRTLARFVQSISIPTILHGVVAKTDEKNFTLTIALPDEKTITTDIETSTKTSFYTKEGGIVKSGFSKIKVGQRIMIVGFPDLKDKSKYIASRIIVFPNISKNPKIEISVEPTIQPTTAISTGSGKTKK